MTRFLLSTLLSVAGVAAALAVRLAAGALVKLGGRRVPPLLCMAVSAAYGASQLIALARQQSGLACALVPGRTMLLHGALLAVHLGLLGGLLRRLRQIAP